MEPWGHAEAPPPRSAAHRPDHGFDGRLHRQHRPTRDPTGPRCHRSHAAAHPLGVPPGARQPHRHRGAARRPGGPPAGVPVGTRPVHRRIARLRPGPRPGRPRRGPSGPRGGRGAADPAGVLPDPAPLPRRRKAPRGRPLLHGARPGGRPRPAPGRAARLGGPVRTVVAAGLPAQRAGRDPAARGHPADAAGGRRRRARRPRTGAPVRRPGDHRPRPRHGRLHRTAHARPRIRLAVVELGGPRGLGRAAGVVPPAPDTRETAPARPRRAASARHEARPDRVRGRDGLLRGFPVRLHPARPGRPGLDAAGGRARLPALHDRFRDHEPHLGADARAGRARAPGGRTGRDGGGGGRGRDRSLPVGPDAAARAGRGRTRGRVQPADREAVRPGAARSRVGAVGAQLDRAAGGADGRDRRDGRDLPRGGPGVGARRDRGRAPGRGGLRGDRAACGPVVGRGRGRLLRPVDRRARPPPAGGAA